MLVALERPVIRTAYVMLAVLTVIMVIFVIRSAVLSSVIVSDVDKMVVPVWCVARLSSATSVRHACPRNCDECTDVTSCIKCVAGFTQEPHVRTSVSLDVSNVTLRDNVYNVREESSDIIVSMIVLRDVTPVLHQSQGETVLYV